MNSETKAGLGIAFVLWLLGRSTRGASLSTPPEAMPDGSGLLYGKLVSPEFASKLTKIAEQLGFDRDDLMTVIRIERGKKGNGLGSGRYHKYTDKQGVTHTGNFSFGLFGMSPATAESLGTTPAALYTMTDEEQLDFVLEFFEERGWAKGGKNDITTYPRWGTVPRSELTQFDAIYSGVFGGQSMIDADLYDVVIDAKKQPELYAQWIKGAMKDDAFKEKGTVTKKDVLSIARNFRKAGEKKK